MSDETTQLIIGDAAADALSQSGRGRRFFRKKKSEPTAVPLTHCENCEASLTGPYCAACGQQAIDYRRSLLRVLVDAADSFLNWDTKFLNSVGVLMTRPWRLTNDFNAGRRARYVHPLRLYLLASIAFFLIAKLINLTPSAPVDLKPEDRAEIDQTLAKLSASDSVFTPAQRAKIEDVRQKIAARGALTAGERADIKSTLNEPDEATSFPQKLRKEQRAELKLALARVPKATASEDSTFIGPPVGAPSDAMPNVKKEPLHITFNNEGKNAPKTPFQQWIEARIKEKVGEDGTKVSLFVDTLRSNIPTMMLCCVPLFAFVLKVLYFRQRRFYVEHLVYALHIHTFAYIAVVAISLLALGAEHWVPGLRPFLIGALSPVAFILVFVSIRRVYRQGWFFTTTKFLLGGFVYLIIIACAVAMTAFVTLLLP